MDRDTYISRLEIVARAHKEPKEKIDQMVDYAGHLMNEGVPVIFDQKHLSKLLGYEYSFLYSICLSQQPYYKEYKIPKRNGGLRRIDEPLPSLKECQRWVLDNILQPYGELNLSKSIKAFIPKKSLRENARFHKAQKLVLCLDLCDFFGSIKEKDVFSVFYSMGYNAPVSKFLTRLCTYNGSLPQGSPSSPMLSNLVFNKYDKIIFSFCQARKIRYTRYADDLTFSGDFSVGEVMGFVNKLLRKSSLSVNNKKTRVARQSMRQCVTGVVVNEKLQVPRAYRKQVRQEIYYIVRFGVDSHMKQRNIKDNAQCYLQRLLGRISFIRAINPQDLTALQWYNYILGLYKGY